MATPTMRMQLDPAGASGATGHVSLVASTTGTGVGIATASGVTIAGEFSATAGRARTVTVTTVDNSATVTGVLRTKDVGKPITGTGIPADTYIVSVGDSTFVMSNQATADGEAITATVDVDGLLTFPNLNPTIPEDGDPDDYSDDAIDDPLGTVYALVLNIPGAPTPETVYFTVPDTAGYYTIASPYLTSRPGALPPPGVQDFLSDAAAGAIIDVGVGISSLDEAPGALPADAVFAVQRGVAPAERITLTSLSSALSGGLPAQTMEGNETYDPVNFLGVVNVSALNYTLTLPALDGDNPRHKMDVCQDGTGTITLAAGAGAAITGPATATLAEGSVLECRVIGKIFGTTLWRIAPKGVPVAHSGDLITSGTVADARIASTIARDSEVTAAVAAEAALARNADNLTSGTIADARIPSTITRDTELADLVTGPASATTARVATFNGTTGKIIQDGGVTVAQIRDRTTHTGGARLVWRNGNAQAIPSASWTPLAWSAADETVTFSALDTSSTTITAGSNGATLPQGTINVASTAAFPSTGYIRLNGPPGANITTLVAYTGKTATTFTGCTLGSGTMATGQVVTLPNHSINLPAAGVYDIKIATTWAAHATGIRGVRLKLAGVVDYAVDERASTNTADQGITTAVTMPTTGAVVVQVEVYQNSGTVLNLNANGLTWPRITIDYIRALT